MAAKASTSPAQKKAAPSKKELSANNFAALVAVGVAVIIVIAGLALNFLIREIILNSKVALAKQAAVHDLDEKIANAPKLIEAYNQLGSRKDLIAHGLPNTADFPETVSIIESIAGASGVKTRSVSPRTTAVSSASAASAAATSGSAKPTQFTLTVDGPYAKIMDFIKNLEKSARPMRVTSIDFKGSGASVSADLEMTTYYQDAVDVNDKTEVIK